MISYRKIFHLVISIIVLSNLCACNSRNTNSIVGEYNISSFIVKGTNISSLWENSYINITGITGDSLSCIYLHNTTDEKNSADFLYGSVVVSQEYDTYTQYEFWVKKHIGTLWDNSISCVNLYHYPENDSIKLKIDNEIILTFTKAE